MKLFLVMTPFPPCSPKSFTTTPSIIQSELSASHEAIGTATGFLPPTLTMSAISLVAFSLYESPFVRQRLASDVTSAAFEPACDMPLNGFRDALSGWKSVVGSLIRQEVGSFQMNSSAT